MRPVQDGGLFILACCTVCFPSMKPGNGNSSLEQSDSICRWFIRPLGPFGLVKHEVRPRPLSYVISHVEPDTTLLTSRHLRSKDQGAYLLVVTTSLLCFSLFVWAIISFFEKPSVCPISTNWACVGTEKFFTKHFFQMHFLSPDLMTTFQCNNTAQGTLYVHVCLLWSFFILLLGKHYFLR